ncbi:MAG TPA: hypothetical protein VH682_32415 [Gemmataceae bacterium]|jgi:hypothetical protein
MFDRSEVLNTKRRRALQLSVGLLALLVGGVLVVAFVEKVRDASDRAT